MCVYIYILTLVEPLDLILVRALGFAARAESLDNLLLYRPVLITNRVHLLQIMLLLLSERLALLYVYKNLCVCLHIFLFLLSELLVCIYT